MKRREALTRATWGMTGAALTACGGADANNDRKKNFLLVHGAWHSAAHWNRVSSLLATMGHRVIAMDLPGAGLDGVFPSSFLTNDQGRLPTEVSPQAGITFANYRDAVITQIRAIASANGPVTLVAHSLGGQPATAAAEAVPELIARIVYVSALVPVNIQNILDTNSWPEAVSAKTNALFISDPLRVAAARINPRNPDPAYQEMLRQGFYNDLPMADAQRFIALLISDVGIQAVAGDARGTASRWGTVPRTFVRNLQDQSMPLAVQDRLIREADAFTPNNKFDVKTLDSSHSPFASKPAELAAILDGLA